MSKKTIEQYKQEFLAIESVKGLWDNKENIDAYLSLAKQCIADFPENELGQIEYGKVAALIASKLFIQGFKRYEYGEALEEFRDFTANSLVTAKTYISFLPEDAPFIGDLNYLFRVKHPKYSEIYYLCGELLAQRRFYKEAANEFAIYYELTKDYSRFIGMLNQPLEFFTIDHYASIKNLVVKDIANCKEIYFLGENGVGKTILLQSLVSEIVKDINEHSLNEVSVRSYQNIFAYGTARFRTGLVTDEYFDKTGFDTLFDRNLLLTDVEWWLKDLQRRELLKNANIALHTVIDLLQEVINFDNSSEFKIEYDPKADKFVFREKETTVEFENIADGYRSVLIWLCDLIRRLIENQPYICRLDDFYGIVLIDEIDMFLHPKWEYTIVQKLRSKLPNIQWFLTTHSPLLVLGASKDAVFYKMYKEGGVSKISEQWQYSDIDNLLANAILTSPLFDLDSARMREFDESAMELDTNTNYYYSKIGKIIKQDKAERKNKGQNYFSEEEIQNIVQEAIAKFNPKE